ncbi:hypothetical protein AB0399_26070 [Streptomyces sp. NPDC088194]|uniref:hypothetical protein n=1 Tax=Streptomyces sp. NPDC088194 TaxID=3154931 RepID=UPI00344C087E
MPEQITSSQGTSSQVTSSQGTSGQAPGGPAVSSEATGGQAVDSQATGQSTRKPILFHPLVYLEDGDGVTIGRADIDSYAIFPPDGAQLVRWLEGGATADEAARRYRDTYGESADVEDVLAALEELGFTRTVDEEPAETAPLRWQRLGRATFSPYAWFCYAALAVTAVVLMARSPSLVPRSHDLVFSSYYSLVNLTLLVAVTPLIALHEIFHALAGRRLAIRSRLSMSYRFYFLVVETALDGLVAVPRRKRYLPILAGMLADVLVLCALVVLADVLGGTGSHPSLAGRVCLGVAFATFTRLLWQFFFYLRTDIYVLITTMLGNVDLHGVALRTLRNRVNRLLGRRDKITDLSTAHPVDLKAARWYAWLVLAGYTISLSTTLFALLPVFVHMCVNSVERFTSGGASALRLLDSVVFLVLLLTQTLLPLWIALRDRARRRSEAVHVVA